MIWKSEKRTEKLLVIAVATIFLLLLLLTSSNPVSQIYFRISPASLNEQYPESNLLEPMEPVYTAQQADSNELNGLNEPNESIELNEAPLPDEPPNRPRHPDHPIRPIQLNKAKLQKRLDKLKLPMQLSGAAQIDTAGSAGSWPCRIQPALPYLSNHMKPLTKPPLPRLLLPVNHTTLTGMCQKFACKHSG